MSTQVEVQTEKADNKIIPCTYEGCGMQLRVNKFYAPAKGRCSEHSGVPSATIRALAANMAPAPDRPVEPNGSLADLRCPLCRSSMKVLRVRTFETMEPWISFGCNNGHCGTFIEVKPKWSALIIADIPEAWKEFVAMYNANTRAIHRDEIGAE